MVLLAKRVSAAQCAPKSASTSEMPSALAMSCTCPNSSLQLAIGRMVSSKLTGIRRSHFDVVEARGACTVAGGDHLLGLSLAAVGNTPQHPMIAIGNGRARVPKLRGDAAIGRVLQHTNALTIFDFPGDLAAELEVVALVVDGPTAIGLHVNGAAHAGKNFLERLLARQQADVGHADQRKAGPTGGAHGAVRALLADGGGRLARGHVSDELAVTNNVGRLRRNTLVIERERAHARAVFDARVANRVHQIGTIAQMIQLVEREKAHPR